MSQPESGDTFFLFLSELIVLLTALECSRLPQVDRGGCDAAQTSFASPYYSRLLSAREQ